MDNLTEYEVLEAMSIVTKLTVSFIRRDLLPLSEDDIKKATELGATEELLSAATNLKVAVARFFRTISNGLADSETEKQLMLVGVPGLLEDYVIHQISARVHADLNIMYFTVPFAKELYQAVCEGGIATDKWRIVGGMGKSVYLEAVGGPRPPTRIVEEGRRRATVVHPRTTTSTED